MTQTQFAILASLGWLAQNQNEISQKDIADNSNTDRMMVSKILRTLQQKEFIERHENEKDTRSKLVSLTEKGIIKLQEALKQVEITERIFFRGLKKKTILTTHYQNLFLQIQRYKILIKLNL